MKQRFLVKLTSLILLTLAAAWLMYPTYRYYWRANPLERADAKLFCDHMPQWSHCHKVVLGLDLQGGLYLVMGVVVDKAVTDRTERVTDTLKARLTDKKIAFEQIRHLEEAQSALIEVRLKDLAAAKAFDGLMSEDFSALEVISKEGDGKTYRVSFIKAEQERIKSDAVEQAIKTIRNRADKYGVSEPTIARRGEDSILIQLPGVKDPRRAVETIGRTAQLEFYIVDDESNGLDGFELPAGVTRAYEATRSGSKSAYLLAATKQALLDAAQGHIPEARSLKLAEVRDGAGKVEAYRTYLVSKRPGITGDYLTNASVGHNESASNKPYVSFSFDTEGAKIFGDLTGNNIGKRLAIVLDDMIDSAPVINSKISGDGMIELGAGKDAKEVMEDAQNLVLVLKSGALAAPVVVREQREVGASLGSEAVHKGQMAMAIGLLLVVLWMAIYYKWSGLIANVALIFNFIFLIALLAGLDATLTLPGMAGIALTLGIAIDANVIILERVREELRAGKSAAAAIEAGYDKAFWTIFDAHVTAFVSGVILWEYGSGPVRGFATTLIIGIIASLYTSIVITKMVYEYKMARGTLEKLSV